jgi:hypothetical protein
VGGAEYRHSIARDLGDKQREQIFTAENAEFAEGD